MHVLTHDFAGHPFQVELSRSLARRGHRVTHAYCASLETTPRAALATRRDDPAGLAFEGLDLGAPLSKYSYARRWMQERRYGRMVAALAERVRPDVVLSANTPLDAQARLQAASRRMKVPFVFWLQDVIGVATERLLRRKLAGAGAAVGRHYVALEARLLRRSDAVVLITDDFRGLLRGYGVADARMTTIENWAPLEEVPERPKQNPWSHASDLDSSFAFVYSGTMGLKHNPELLARLAESTLDRPEVRVVVLSQGPGADYLRAARESRGLTNLRVQGYEPFEALPDVLGAADVLLAVLEPEAGVFSVPSKVLTYLCAGRPLLAAMPHDNLASKIVTREGAGVVVAPDDVEAFVAAGRRLLDDPAARHAMGAAGRAYAERAFDIERITDRFETVLDKAVGGRR